VEKNPEALHQARPVKRLRRREIVNSANRWEQHMTIARTVFMIFILPFIGSSFCGCTEEPTPFSLNQEIRMGSYKLRVSKYSTGTVGQYIPNEIVPTESNEKLVKILGSVRRDSPAFVVFFSYSREGNEGNIFFSLTTLNNKMFYLMNKNGEKIYPLAVLPKRFLFMGEGWIMDYNDVEEAIHDLKNPKDFFAIFITEKGSSGFTLFIKNPSQQNGQAGLASLTLGS
jgi:hypothetical protein